MLSRKLVVLVMCFLVATLAITVRLAVAMPSAQEPEPIKPFEQDTGETVVVDNVTEVLTATEGFQLPVEPVAAIMTENFEGAWPATGWELADTGSNDGGEYLWAKRNCHPHTGSYAGWSVGGGAQGSALSCTATYPNNAYTWAIYGPFDLRGVISASLTFHVWGQTEGGTNCPYDFLYVGSSTDSQQFLGSRYCGDWTAGPDGNGYTRRTFDLASRLGQSQVWVGFLLRSDFSNVFNGITVDDLTLDAAGTITLTHTPTPTPTQTPTRTPTPTPTRPASQSAKVNLPLVVKRAPTPTLTPTPTPVPAHWQWQRGAVEMNDVYFSDASHGWAVGPYGMIVASEDGGRTWRSQYSTVTNNLNGVQFVNNSNGWIIGEDGIILHTANGGRTWTRQDSTVTVDLSALSFVNTQLGWVGLPDGVLKTTDGGATWSRTGTGISARVQDIQFLDANTGLVVTNTGSLHGGKIMRSTDGGATWQNATCNYTWGCGLIWALHMPNHNFGAAVGGHVDPQIMLTHDGGLTWQPVSTSATFAVLKSVFFVDPSHGWALDPDDYELRLMRTIDGGQNWSTLPYANFADGMHFTSSTSGYLTSFPGVRTTGDAGQTWSVPMSFDVSNWRDVQFNNSNTGWVVGWRQILRTRDGGQTWEVQRQNNSESFNALHFSDLQHGWVVGDAGKILVSSDSGATWGNQTANTDYHLNDVDFVDNLYGWIVGSAAYPEGHGRIWRTTDGGVHWSESAYFPGSDAGKFGIDFVNRTTGYAVGKATATTGSLYKTTNGGSSWTPVLSGNYAVLLGIDCIDANTCWAVGNRGTILRTVNGGTSWDLQATGTSTDLMAVDFLDRQKGYAVGPGVVLHTTDAGLTWNEVETIGLTQGGMGVAYPDAGHVWIVGGSGRIEAFQ